MKANFENIGPVDRAGLELGELTLICGSNNSGKTYMASALYGLYRFLNNFPIGELGGGRSLFPGVDVEMVNELNSGGLVLVNLDIETLASRSTRLTRLFVKAYNENLHKIFKGNETDFHGTNVGLTFNRQDIMANLRDNLESLITPKEVKSFIIHYDKSKNMLIISRAEVGEGEKNHKSKKEISNIIEDVLLRFRVSEPFMLTSQRNGIAQFYKELDAKRNEVTNEYINSMEHSFTKSDVDASMSRYSLPIGDEINFIRHFDEITRTRGKFKQKEIELLCGYILQITNASYERVDNVIRHISQGSRKPKFDIPLHLASASSNEMAELYLYFRHRAQKGDLLIMDEPESHLCNQSQIYMARLFSACVKVGLKVMVTTHSEIVIKEINNLVMLGQLSDLKKREIKEMIDDQHGINGDVIRAYYSNNGNISSCEVNKWGISVQEFDLPHARLHRKAVMLYSHLDEDDEDEHQ